MNLVLCHTTADFDTLGAAAGAVLLQPGSRIVLAGNAHPTVRDFLAIWRDEYPLVDRRAVAFDQVRSLTLVDASSRDRFSPLSDWFDQAERSNIPITIYDHHLSETDAERNEKPSSPDFPSAEVHIEAVGAATTLIVEALQRKHIVPSPFEATVMALGIHSDTGSLTFEQATSRDAQALAWLMAQGANQQTIAENKEPGLSPQLQDLLGQALEVVQTETVRGHQLGWVRLETQSFTPGLSGLAGQLMTLLGLDTLLLCAKYQAQRHPRQKRQQKMSQKAVMIGRSHPTPLLPNSRVDLRSIFEPLGGGGHAQAASATLKAELLAEKGGVAAVFEQALAAVRSQIPALPTAKSLMSSPVRTILPATSVDEAQRISLRYGHTGLCVVNDQAELVGIISRRDIDIALRHGLGHAPVKGCMSRQIKSIAPETPLTQIQDLMVTYDIGRLPVLQAEKLVGIVTRTDLLRQLHQTQQAYPRPNERPEVRSERRSEEQPKDRPKDRPEDRSADLKPQVKSASPIAIYPPAPETLYQQLKNRIPQVWPALMLIAEVANQNGWALYLVGGAVRDLLLAQLPEPNQQFHPLTDIDLVVDGAEPGAGVALAEAIKAQYPQVSVQVHGQFQTAALTWHPTGSSESDQPLEPLLIDIATARTEFYPYPAANPEVEASSIRQDLYRRDFTINAMAIRLNGSDEQAINQANGAASGQLLDYFGGWQDLQQGHIRVLHANSFIEDPTRIFRAVRFAVRLGFTIEPQTEQFIRYAISSGVYAQAQANRDKTPALQTRLKAELKYLLSGDQWQAALTKISRLGALACLHSDLEMTPALCRQMGRMNRWLNRFDDRTLGITQPRWLILLELIIAQLDPPLRDRTAINLSLDAQSQHLLKNLHLWEAALLKQLPKAQRPSQIYELLQPYDISALLLMCDRHPYTLGPQIWQYIIRLSHQPPLINGSALKRLGYQPGPQFKDIISTINAITLNGELTTPQEAESYVLSHYPL
ncbi:MAG: CBS domain-containing protein [Phormidesmis sp.]